LRIRILLTGLSHAVADALELSLELQRDMEVIGHLSDPIEVLLAATQDEVDVVILGLQDDELPGIASHMLSERPQLRILALGRDGRRAFLYRLRPQVVPLGELSPERLIEAIRTVMRADPG
jgi:DNA-binding NarL/FixJ family response regulator